MGANKNFISKTKVKHAIVVTVFLRFKQNLFFFLLAFFHVREVIKKSKTVIA